MPLKRRRAAPIAVWCGDYRYGGEDFFFRQAVAAGRKYVDKTPEQRPPERPFREELERLRSIAPAEGSVLLDQLEHRWRHPDCPPSLYVVTCTLSAPEGGAMVAGAAESVQELLCSKVGAAGV